MELKSTNNMGMHRFGYCRYQNSSERWQLRGLYSAKAYALVAFRSATRNEVLAAWVVKRVIQMIAEDFWGLASRAKMANLVFTWFRTVSAASR